MVKGTPLFRAHLSEKKILALGSHIAEGCGVRKPFQLFNWPAGMPANDQFSSIKMDGGLQWNVSQLYNAGIVTLYSGGDTNRDGVLNSLDIDAIYQHLTVAPPSYVGIWPRTLLTWSPALAQCDVNGDGAVTQDDVTYELNHYFLTNYGAANLDTATGFVDFQTLLNNWQNSGAGIGWTQADFNGDGTVDFLDFQMLLNYWSPGGWNFAPSEAPEPASVSLIILGGLALFRRKA
jgi:hypothetical protein